MRFLPAAAAVALSLYSTAGLAGNVVDLTFSGVFSEGSLAGISFTGTLKYDRDLAPTSTNGTATRSTYQSPNMSSITGGTRTLASGFAAVDNADPGVSVDRAAFGTTGRVLGGRDNFLFSFTDPTGLVLDNTSLPSANQLFAFSGRSVAYASATEDGSGTFTIQATAAPEAATWGMMMGGMGIVGSSMRRRRSAAARLV